MINFVSSQRNAQTHYNSIHTAFWYEKVKVRTQRAACKTKFVYLKIYYQQLKEIKKSFAKVNEHPGHNRLHTVGSSTRLL